MKFHKDNKELTLQGDPSLERTMISLKAMLRVMRREKGGVMVELNGLGAESSGPEKEIPSFISSLVAHYDRVFEMPARLPPKRGHEGGQQPRKCQAISLPTGPKGRN